MLSVNLADTIFTVSNTKAGTAIPIHEDCNYLGEKAKPSISICFDETVDQNDEDTSGFNYNTLEPKLLKVNSLDTFNSLFGKSFASENELRQFMKNNKTECALAIFGSEQKINYPEYIVRAVKDEQ